jgi:hypothetical protein
VLGALGCSTDQVKRSISAVESTLKSPVSQTAKRSLMIMPGALGTDVVSQPVEAPPSPSTSPRTRQWIVVKLTTWNVNGIRARLADVLAWIERERPDVLCMQEIKAAPEQLPEALCRLDDYHCYWHGSKGYSGVGLLLARQRFPEPPVFAHPAFDHETRIVTARVGQLEFASIYVPNGGKDLAAKVRFLDAFSRASSLSCPQAIQPLAASIS